MTTALKQIVCFHQATFGGRLCDGLSAAELFTADVLFVPLSPIV